MSSPEVKKLKLNSEDASVIEEKDEKGPRPAFSSNHKITKDSSKYNLLIGVTGSVACIKLVELLEQLKTTCMSDKLAIKIVTTDAALKLMETQNFNIEEIIYEDRDEWSMWKGRGDLVLHIELRKWADSMLIAPLDANSMAKIALGLCDNLLTSVVRAWDPRKPLFYAPAMNTMMWDNPLTAQHRKTLKELLRFKEIPPMEKSLMCGDHGIGAMATVNMISTIIAQDVKNKFSIYSQVRDNY
ncbi:unnamed protein product [Auanema sp. JU1783]|nr:unnamed protein product [Auanema sp. JU1783]